MLNGRLSELKESRDRSEGRLPKFDNFFDEKIVEEDVFVGSLHVMIFIDVLSGSSFASTEGEKNNPAIDLDSARLLWPRIFQRCGESSMRHFFRH